MHAVDAAIGPEVEQHHLALEILEVDRLVGVEPLDVAEAGRGRGGRRRRGTCVGLPGAGEECEGEEAHGPIDWS